MSLPSPSFRCCAGSFVLLSFVLGTASLCSAGTVTYNYTGNDYTTCAGTYCTGGPYALSVSFTTTLTGGALDNLPFTDISSTITSFTFTDGSGLTINNSNGPDPRLYISTNASGNFVGWLIAGCIQSTECNTQMQTNWNSSFGFQPGRDVSETTLSFAGSYGFIGNDPGTWTSALNGFQGGPSSMPVYLLSGPPVADVTGTIGGQGSQDYYWFQWPGGAFSATGGITGASAGASYLFSEGGAGSCSSGGTATLNSSDSFSGTISFANLAPGQYCIGIDANNLNDPSFSLTFNTPVEGVATPEPSTLLLLSVGLGTACVVRLRKRSRKDS
jgi:hypothetical protein